MSSVSLCVAVDGLELLRSSCLYLLSGMCVLVGVIALYSRAVSHGCLWSINLEKRREEYAT